MKINTLQNIAARYQKYPLFNIRGAFKSNRDSGLGTFNFTGIKRDDIVAVLHAVVSGKCVLLMIGGAHVAGQSRDR
jgi:hypothetical protein